MFDASEPFEPFHTWYAEAVEAEPRVPDAMQLATVGPGGVPSLRTVLMKGFGMEGITFFTNLGSRKARELAANPQAAVLFHWKSLERQVIVEGRVGRVSDEEADAYFATRPRGSQLGAWASRQSEEIATPLAAEIARLAEVHQGREVPRPPFWGGYLLVPSAFEFWQGRPDRLHDRLVYVRTPTGWTRRSLQP